MPGHARERRPGVFELRAYAGRDPVTGRKVYRTRTIRAAGQREAEREAARFALDLADNGPRASSTVGELLEAWFETCSGEWAPSTALETRRRIDRTLSPIHDRIVAEITTGDLSTFYARLRRSGGRGGRPLATSTVIRVHTDLVRAFEHAIDLELRTDNPARRARPGRAEPAEIVPPSAEDVGAILAAAAETDPEVLAFLFLAAETGGRRAELGAVRVSDLGAGTVTIRRALAVGLDTAENRTRYAGHCWPATVRRGERATMLVEKPTPKTRHSIRTIALAPATVELLVAQRRRLEDLARSAGGIYPGDGFLFPATPDGDRPLRPDTWTHRYGRIRDELGLAVRLHDLRHFVATTLLAGGVDLATVAGRLGHGGGGKTTLAIYGHLLEEPDRVASELMAGVLETGRSSASSAGADVVDLGTRRRSS